MSQKLFEAWNAILVAGAPFFPYIGLALLVVLGLLLLWLCVYLVFRAAKRLPPALRYFGWRLGLLAGLVTRRDASREAAPLYVREGDAVVPFAKGFRALGWFGRAGCSGPEPVFVVVGATGAGKSALLRAMGTGLLDQAPTREANEPALQWWSLDNARVLEIDSRLWEELPARFADLLHRLARRRPQRPIEGVVVVVQARDLLDPQAAKSASMARLGEAVRKLGVTSGHRIPLRIVISGVEHLTGFDAFAPLVDRARAASMFRFDRAAGTASLATVAIPQIEAALLSWGEHLRLAGLALLADAPLNAGFGERVPAVHFCNQMPSLCSGVKSTWRVLRGASGPGEATPALREVCIVGLARSAGPNAIPGASASPRLTFLEPGQSSALLQSDPDAPPTPAFRARAQRAVVTAGMALVVSMIFLTVLLPMVASRIHENAGVWTDALSFALAPAGSGVAEGGAVSEPLSAVAMLQSVARVAATARFEWLAPSSWFNGIRQRVLAWQGQTIQQQWIERRIAALTQEAPRPAAEVSATVRGGGVDRADELPADRALRDYLQRTTLRDHQLETADGLARGISYDDLAAFLDLPIATGTLPAWRGRDDLPGKVVEQFVPVASTDAQRIREWSRPSIMSLWERELSEGLDEHPLVVVAEQITESLNRLGRAQTLSAAEATELGERLVLLQREATRPAARRVLGTLPDTLAFFGAPLARLHRSSLVTMDDAREATEALSRRRDTVRRRLLASTFNGVDPVFVSAAADGTLALSAEFRRLSLSYAGFLAQPFMQRAGSPAERRSLSSGSTLTWDVARLGPVLDIAASVREYSLSGVQAMDAMFRPGLVRLAQDQARTAIDAFFWREARSASAPEALQTTLDPVSALRPAIGNVSAVAKLYRQAVPLRDDPLSSPGSVGEALTAQVVDLLGRLEVMLRAEDVYGTIIGDVRRWMDAATPSTLSTVMRGAPQERLALARGYVRAQYIAPASQLLEALVVLSPESARHESAQSWRRLVESLDGLDKGVPGGSAIELEQYVLALAKWSGQDDCGRFLAERAPVTFRADHFGTTLAALDASVTQACARRKLDGEQRIYGDFVTWFNDQAAGRAPFGVTAGEAPLTQRAFSGVLSRYAEMRKALPDAPRAWSASALEFLDRMDGLVARFGMVARAGATGTDKQGPSLGGGLVARLALRSEPAEASFADQVIDMSVTSGGRVYGLRNPQDPFEWRMGDAIEVRLRWADQSADSPVSSLALGRYQVHEREAIYRFGGDWALLDLVRERAKGGDGLARVVLQFPVQVVSREGRRVARLNMTLSAMGPSSALGVEVPSRAPSLPTASWPSEGSAP